MNGYPVRGIIEQAKTGLLSIEASTDVINIFIKKSYNEGVMEGLSCHSEATGGRIRGEVIQTPTTMKGVL